jgi:plasmid stabilization system protein ParE
MELKWTSKALSDLARLYEFLVPVNPSAAAQAVQELTTKAAATLLAHPRIGTNFRIRPPRSSASARWALRDALRDSRLDPIHIAAVAYPRGSLIPFRERSPRCWRQGCRYEDHARALAEESRLSNAHFLHTSFAALADAGQTALPPLDFIVLHGVLS